MYLNITTDILINLKKFSLSLEEFLLLHWKYNGYPDITEVYSIPHIIYLKLRSKKYLDNTNTLTEKGREVYRSIVGESEINSYDEEFELFWEAFPTDDRWGVFLTTRRIKAQKSKAKSNFIAVRNSGITTEELIEAVKTEVAVRKAQSISNNSLTYMQSPTTWLNNRTFESWLKSNGENTATTNSNNYGKDIV